MELEQVEGHAASLAHRLLLGIVRFACRFPKLILVIGLLLSAASLYFSCTHLQYHTQRSDLINPHKDYQERWRRFLVEFGEEDDMVVVVRGNQAPLMRDALESLAAAVNKRSDQFDRLFYKVDLRPIRNRALLFLPQNEIAEIQSNVKSMGMLLDFGPVSWQALSLIRLLREGHERVARLSARPMSPSDVQFMTQLRSICRSAAASVVNPANYRNPWNSLLAQPPQQASLLDDPQYFFSGDGTLAFLLVRPIKASGSFTGAHRSVETMRAIILAARPTFPELEFGLTGLPVLETDEMVAAERDTRWASWLAIGGVTILFFVVYRSLYYPLLTVGTLLIGTSWALGWLTLTVGHLNILSATFAVMLIGMGDYGVLWVMRYESERKRGAAVEVALQRTAICVGTGTLTAALTTALAFFAAMFADFQAVAELGWIAGSGVLLCAFACFTMLPASLRLADRRTAWANPDGSRAPGMSSPVTRLVFANEGTFRSNVWLPGLAGRARRVIAGCLAMTAVLAACAASVEYDHNLLHLQAKNLESVKWELALIDHTAGASWRALSYRPSQEEVLALKAQFERLPEVSRVVEVASLIPSDQAAKLDMLKDIQRRLQTLPPRDKRIPHSRPDGSDLIHELTGLLHRLAELERTQPLLADLRGSLEDLCATLKRAPASPVTEARIQHFEEQMAGDLAGDLYRLRDVSTPAPIGEADLPGPLRERFIGRSGNWLLQIFAKESLWDFKPLEHFAKQIYSVDSTATGKPFATVEGLKAMKSGFQWAGLYALMAIVVVLLLDFRSLRRMLLALSPLLMGLTFALGAMGLFGVALNPANMIALPLVLGVGVDNGVHVLHDYLSQKSEGRRTISRAIGRGVLVKALTTMIGFGTLMVSTQQGLIGLGFCLMLGVGCCMFTALVFLPAVLSAVNHSETEVSRAPQTQNELQNLAA